VHGFITLGEKEQRLVASPLLQRLRGIRQLALASLVYPGALHTRFDHTLGVMHVAGKMAETLGLGREDVVTVREAALLHDIGHGPLSHVSEYALERYAVVDDASAGQRVEKIHERVTELLIRNDPCIQRVLGEETCDDVARVLATGRGERIVRQIVSGPLDADKQDYLLRDSYFCGVQYGIFDHHQLHRSLVSVPDEHDHVLMIRADGVHAVEQYVLAKYYLTTNVYRHKVRLITDQMIIRAIVLGIERDQIAELRSLYAFDGSPEFAARYAEWDDARFLQSFGLSGTNGKCKEMLQRLVRRDLLKRVFSGRPLDFNERVREQLLELVRTSRDPGTRIDRDTRRRRIESGIADVIRERTGAALDEDFVIYHAFSVKSVKEMSRNDEASILVSKRPKPIPFEEESALFQSISEGFDEEFVEVYAPIFWENHADREKQCRQFRVPIIEIIEGAIAPRQEGAQS
jgi:hypothetical protein